MAMVSILVPSIQSPGALDLSNKAKLATAWEDILQKLHCL